MSRSIFGWSLPPGVTQRQIDEAYGQEGPCEVCCKSTDLCICPECLVCGSQGDPKCYKKHNLKLDKDQAISRQQARMAVMRERLFDEECYLVQLQQDNDYQTYELADIPDPYK